MEEANKKMLEQLELLVSERINSDIEIDNLQDEDINNIIIKNSFIKTILDEIFKEYIIVKIVPSEYVEKITSKNTDRFIKCYLKMNGFEVFNYDDINKDLSDIELSDESNDYVGNNTDIYRIDVGNFPLLTPEEEIDLFTRLNNGDTSVKNKIINCNLRLVLSIAKRYINENYLFEDIVQDGSLGLIRAVEDFDVEKGFKFSTYATWWIRQSITRALAEKSLNIRHPYNQVTKANLINKAKLEILTEKGKDATVEELVDKTRLDKKTILDTIKNFRNTQSLNYVINQEEEKTELIELVGDKNVSVEDSIVNKELHLELCSSLDLLVPKKKFVTALRYSGKSFLKNNEKEIIKVREIIKKNNIESTNPIKIKGIARKSTSEIYDEFDDIIINLYKNGSLNTSFAEDNYDYIKQVILYNLVFNNNPISVETYKEIKEKHKYILEQASKYIKEDKLTLKEVGELFDITYQAIEQIEDKSLETIKNSSNSEKIKGFL